MRTPFRKIGLIQPKEFLTDAIELQKKVQMLSETIEFDQQFQALHEAWYPNVETVPKQPNLLETIVTPKNRVKPTEPDLLYTISVYVPKSSQKMVQFQVLSSQPISIMRDVLFCLSDFIQLDHAPQVNTIEQKTSPYFLFIEDTFYIKDNPQNESIIDQLQLFWKKMVSMDSKLNSFTVKSIDTLFRDIPIAIKHDYLFHHQSDCGHVFQIDEIRLLHSMDSREYPFILFQHKISRPMCCACQVVVPTVVAYNCYQGPYEASLWCISCLQEFYPAPNQVIMFPITINIPFAMQFHVE